MPTGWSGKGYVSSAAAGRGTRTYLKSRSRTCIACRHAAAKTWTDAQHSAIAKLHCHSCAIVQYSAADRRFIHDGATMDPYETRFLQCGKGAANRFPHAVHPRVGIQRNIVSRGL